MSPAVEVAHEQHYRSPRPKHRIAVAAVTQYSAIGHEQDVAHVMLCGHVHQLPLKPQQELDLFDVRRAAEQELRLLYEIVR